MDPKVSFVIPCYKLAHLLPQCIDSILSQTFTDFEILVMNDRSPDNTAEVATSYTDPRVIHILNEKNLGHLRNYNRGISSCRGEYIWLISADDYLRSPEILRKYVGLMEAHPRIGFTICPGFAVKNGQEGDLIGTYGGTDAVIDGHVFLKKLLDYNFVLAASAMVRRKCYLEIGMFPLTAEWAGQQVDMGWLGDWYLWCMYALRYDIGYFGEPMVCYRDHDLSMTVAITRKEVIAAAAASDVGMLWMVRHEAEKAALRTVARDCLIAIGNEYRRQGASKHYRIASYRLDRKEFEQSVNRSTKSVPEREWIRAKYFLGSGDGLRARRKFSSATRFYLASLRKNPSQPKVYAKLLLNSFDAFRLNGHRFLGKLRRAIPAAAWGPGKIASSESTEWNNRL